MNRYRTIPGLGPQKATSSTTCQKCLQKDNYECKASLQDRPYSSRPSRSQQFSNPKLAPKLTNDKPNELLESKGVADDILAKAKASRRTEQRGSGSSPDAKPARDSSARNRSRSASVSSADSVSTISTSRSRSKSRSPFRRRMSRDDSPARRPRRYSSRSMSKARGRKRRRTSMSSSRSPSRPRQPGSNRKNRRYRTLTPEDRGRPDVDRRGSYRESGSPSVDKSKATRDRRSFDQVDKEGPGPKQTQSFGDESRHGQTQSRPVQRRPPRQRSLSPYSKRLALTQAMNMDR